MGHRGAQRSGLLRGVAPPPILASEPAFRGIRYPPQPPAHTHRRQGQNRTQADEVKHPQKSELEPGSPSPVPCLGTLTQLLVRWQHCRCPWEDSDGTPLRTNTRWVLTQAGVNVVVVSGFQESPSPHPHGRPSSSRRGVMQGLWNLRGWAKRGSVSKGDSGLNWKQWRGMVRAWEGWRMDKREMM